MSVVNTWLTTERTQELQRLVREIVNDPATYQGSRLLPSVSVSVDKLLAEVVEASGGTTNEHVPGTDVKYVQGIGSRVQEFVPPKYKEAIHYDEQKILFLRKLGDNGRNVRGIQQRIDLDVDKLNRRLEARIELERWNAIFNGGFTYQGVTASYGIPAANRVVPVGALWSLDGLTANASADPIKDLRYWLQGGTARFRKYTIGKIWCNPNTARWILDNANVRTFATSYAANPVIGSLEINKVLQFLVPGLPEVIVYNGWYQTESVDSEGKVSVSDAVFFIPDGYLFFEPASLPGGDKLGEFQQTVHLAEGSVETPGSGKFLVFDDHTAPGTQGGPKNPFLDIVAGVYGGVNLYRPFDVLTAKVIA